MERKRILLAVNDPDRFQKLKKELVRTGNEVQIADNGITALKRCSEFRPHLLASELNLKNLDGHHLLREVRAQAGCKQIPFVLMSEHRSVAERVHSINLGVDDYISIPFETEEVVVKFTILLKELEKYEAYARPVSRGFSGYLSDINLVELLQTLEVGKKSCVVKIHHENYEGSIFLKEGQLYDASYANLPARDALFKMFTWNEGSFRVDLKEVGGIQEFNESNSQLIAQGANYKADWLKAIQNLPVLTTSVKPGRDIAINNRPDIEISLLNSIQNVSKLEDIIEQFGEDEFETIRLLARLLKKGDLIQVDDLPKNGNGFIKTSGNKHTAPESIESQINRLVVNFIEPKKDCIANLAAQRKRRNRRRGSDRRTGPRRWSDLIGEKNRVCLNKSELLMIKDKLSNGRK